MSYQLKKVRLLSYKLHAAFTPSAHFRPKKAPRAIFSRGGGRVYFGVNGQFLCLGGPSYGHWKTMRVVLKNFFDLTPLSPYPNQGGHLASINSQDEQNEVVKATDDKAGWLGANKSTNVLELGLPGLK